MDETTNSFDFRAAAKVVNSTCELTVDRTPIKTDEIVNQPLTVIAFDFAVKYDKIGNIVTDENGEAEQYAVIVFREYPDRYYNCGLMFTNVCRSWASGFNGDTKEASYALAESGGVTVKFFKTSTRKGNNFVNFTIV